LCRRSRGFIVLFFVTSKAASEEALGRLILANAGIKFTEVRKDGHVMLGVVAISLLGNLQSAQAIFFPLAVAAGSTEQGSLGIEI
jgi:hypothetical protein